jgi:hypothetical protein
MDVGGETAIDGAGIDGGTFVGALLCDAAS